METTDRTSGTPDLTALIATAETAVERLEQTPHNQPHAEPLRDAVAALEALKAQADAVVFPTYLAPASGGTLADLNLFADLVSASTGPQDLARLHASALQGHPELATAIRGPRGRMLLNAAATRLSLSPRQAADLVAPFERDIATQLTRCEQLLPASEILATILPTLRERMEDARAAHDAAAAAAVARVTAEQDELDRVIAQTRQERKQALIARARNLPELVNLDGELVTGNFLAGRIEATETDTRLDALEDMLVAAETAFTLRLRRRPENAK